VQNRLVGRPLRHDRHFPTLQVGEGFEGAAVDEVFAYHECLVIVAVDAHALVGDNAKLDSAVDRIVKTRRGRAATSVEVAGAERQNHLGTGIKIGEFGLEAFRFQVAPLLGDIKGDVRAQVDDADLDGLELLNLGSFGEQAQCCDCNQTARKDHQYPSSDRLRLPRRSHYQSA
jgi:hypothetical protein